MILNQDSTSINPLNDHRVDLGDLSIFYQQGGKNSASTPIVFLHGWDISSQPYKEVLSLLAEQHSIIAPDLPSFARSTYSELISDYDTYAKFILHFLDALNLQQVGDFGIPKN